MTTITASTPNTLVQFAKTAGTMMASGALIGAGVGAGALVTGAVVLGGVVVVGGIAAGAEFLGKKIKKYSAEKRAA